MKKVNFTKHAYEKFAFLKRYGFEVDEDVVRQAVGHPVHVDRRGDQMLALRLSTRSMQLGLCTRK